MKGFVFVGDMNLTGEVAGFVPGAFRRAGKKTGELLLGGHHHAEAKFVELDHRAGPIHDLSHGGPFVSDDHRVRHYRAQPMEEVQYLRSAYSGKKVFIAARKTDDFMREHRADNDDPIVIE